MMNNQKSITYYDFDLDKSAEERWGPILDTMDLEYLTSELRKVINSYGMMVSLARPLLCFISKEKIFYYDEIMYIASRLQMSFFEVLIMQLAYESSSACTSTVLNVGSDKLFFRTMDWPLLFLKDYTIGLTVIKGGIPIARVTTWACYVGFLTATSINHKFSLAINFRSTSPNFKENEVSIMTLIKNLYRTMTLKWPIGYLIRDIMSKDCGIEDSSYYLHISELISPCYITMYAPNNKSFVITRNCDSVENIRDDNLIQANCDFDKVEPNILYSLQRRDKVAEVQRYIDEKMFPIMGSDGEQTYDINLILEKLLVFPIKNEETIYYYYQYRDKFDTILV